MDYPKLTGFLIEACRAQQKEIDELQAKVDGQQKDNEELKARLDKLENRL